MENRFRFEIKTKALDSLQKFIETFNNRRHLIDSRSKSEFQKFNY